MIVFLWRTVVSLISSAVALIVTAIALPNFHLHLTGFFIAVGIFTLAQAILAPFVFNLARQYASPVLGGIGIVSTLLALVVTSFVKNALSINGLSTWLGAAILVWCITALGGWALMALATKRFIEARTEGQAADRAADAVMRRRRSEEPEIS